MNDHSISYDGIKELFHRHKRFLTVLPFYSWKFKLLPISDVLLVLMIPLGRRWKSYSFPSTTTVCPALFPPCKLKNMVYSVSIFMIGDTPSAPFPDIFMHRFNRLLLVDLLGLLTYQATQRMWPLSSPVGGALGPPEHKGAQPCHKVQHSTSVGRRPQ